MPSDPTRFLIEPLDPAKHRREAFDCGVGPLNEFLRTRARKEAQAGMSVCFVAVPRAEPRQVAGFYTLSAAVIVRAELPEALTKKLPRYRELPATLLGRLARSLDFKRAHLGDLLMVSALGRAVEGAKQVASWAVVTDPKDQHAREFYESFGFRPLTPERLFLTMEEAAALVSVR